MQAAGGDAGDHGAGNRDRPSARLRLVTAGATLGLFLLGFVNTSFDSILREDGLTYLRQAFRMLEGHWGATTHPMGWSALLAGGISVLGLDGLPEGMVLARMLSVLLTALCVLPFAGFARRVAGERAAALAVFAFAASVTWMRLAGIAYADPLFLFLTLCALHVAAGATDGRGGPLIAAAVLASLAYYAKPNGLFVLVALCLFALHVRRRVGLGLLFVAWLPLVFALVSLPHLALRAETFGSPFSYGENSKYFVDSYSQVWDRDVPVPSLMDYLRAHTPSEWFDKFVRSGVLKVGWFFLKEIGVLWTTLLVLAGWRLWKSWTSTLALPLLTLVVFLGGLVPVFHVFGDQRYLAVTLPFVFVLGAWAFFESTDGRPSQRLWTLALLLALAAPVPIAFVSGQLRFRTAPGAVQPPHVRDAWARWAVRHLADPVGILEGEDLLTVALDEARTAGELPPAGGGRARIFRTHRPASVDTLSKALAALRRRGVEYLLVDSRNLDRRPYLREIYEPAGAALVEQVQSFRSTPEDRWQIADMDVFRILPAPD